MLPQDRSPIPPLQPGERGIALICRLSTLVPLWGTVLNALVHFAYRERSRSVSLLALQEVHFSLILLCAIAAKHVLDPFTATIGYLVESESFARNAESTTYYGLWGFYGLFAAYCLAGAWWALSGRVLLYPIIGRRLRRGRGPRGGSDSC